MIFRSVDPLHIVFTLAALLVATTCHEFAHAFVADRLGDRTPRALGRLTLNPLVHLDPIGTLSILFFGFGWARPVPVNARNFPNPRQGMLQVALAGPLANVTVAFLVGALLQIPGLFAGAPAGDFVELVVLINALLAVFNLIPVPPLDGSRVVESLLPPKQAADFARLQPYGMIILLGLLYTGVAGRVMSPAVRWLFHAATGGISGF
jgi:Zn-dependent protease